MAVKDGGLVTVTYKPLDRREIDPVVYGGIEFPVNEPVLLDPKNPKHGAMQLVAKEVAHPIHAGMTAVVHEERRVFWPEILKTNPDFEVEGHDRAVRVKPVGSVPPPGAMWHDDNTSVVDTRGGYA